MSKSIAVALLLVTGLLLGVAAALIAPKPEAKQTIEWLDNPRSLADFSLVSETGDFGSQSLLGHWTILLFGFLHCPDICPTSLSELATVASRLAEIPIDEEVGYVFVSVDPGRDTPNQIGHYVRSFSPSIKGVTGTDEQLQILASNLGIQFKVSTDADNYSVSHSITYSIIDPNGNLRARFRPGVSVAELVENLVPHLL